MKKYYKKRGFNALKKKKNKPPKTARAVCSGRHESKFHKLSNT